jgi:Domain of unknown function (DUF1994).
MSKLKTRKILVAFFAFVAIFIVAITDQHNYSPETAYIQQETNIQSPLAVDVLNTLPVKGRAPKTGYSRDEFGKGWGEINNCDTRNVILRRDLTDTTMDGCLVLSGTLKDPYTNKTIDFARGSNSSAIQIDHVVALSDAWQKGAQSLDLATRKQFANDPINLLAVDGPANQQKSDGDAATWLPPNKSFRCAFITRQISVKHKYQLWITSAEKEAMIKILSGCDLQRILE